MIEYSFLRTPHDLQCGDMGDINALLAAHTTERRDQSDLARTMLYGSVLVARDADRVAHDRAPIVGMGTLFVLPTLVASHGHLEDVLVAPNYGGIEEQLVMRLLEQGSNLGLPHVEIVSDREWARCLHRDRRCVKQNAAVYRWTFAAPERP